MSRMHDIRAILFDKDGTLYDFQATWSSWAMMMIRQIGGSDAARRSALAQAIGFDEERCRFLPHSKVIAGTGREAAALVAPYLPPPGLPLEVIEARISAAAAAVPLVEAVPLRPLLQGLAAAGYRLGVATNDHEAVARQHLGDLMEMFDFVAGFDSGYGAKPGPGMPLAFARHCGLPPEAVLMVGDSRHDLDAGRAAGMRTLAVLTGVAESADLAPHADALRPDIGHLPALLGIVPA
ncbi:MAG: HAD family hydrolase [Pararhodobacter sp.]|nr:HAD family hydrolase [Pararhodobacter sp.]